jgi:hypothetical protein
MAEATTIASIVIVIHSKVPLCLNMLLSLLTIIVASHLGLARLARSDPGRIYELTHIFLSPIFRIQAAFTEAAVPAPLQIG